jgi:lipopolysaccharide heptosyltransferase II
MAEASDWKKYGNILCVRPDNFGDVLMTTPALRALKQAVPGRKITLLTSRAGAGIAPFIPEIDDCIVFDVPWCKHPASAAAVPGLQRTIDEIRSRNFEAAVIFNVFSQNPLPSAMLCYMAGIPAVAGYCRENPYHLMSYWLVDEEPLSSIRHEVVRQLDLVKSLGASTQDESLSLVVPGETLEKLPAKLESLGVDPQQPRLILHAGASEAKRQFPAEIYAEAARILSDELDYRILLTGLEAERDVAERIAGWAGGKAQSLAGMLSLEELIALIKSSPLLVSNNTGPAHIAAAVKTPVVVLYALTNPQHTPWKVRHRVLPFEVANSLQSRNALIRYANERCFRRPTDKVGPTDIVEAVKDLLAERNRPSRYEPGLMNAILRSA